jgi:hypothetical protein
MNVVYSITCRELCVDTWDELKTKLSESEDMKQVVIAAFAYKNAYDEVNRAVEELSEVTKETHPVDQERWDEQDRLSVYIKNKTQNCEKCRIAFELL